MYKRFEGIILVLFLPNPAISFECPSSSGTFPDVSDCSRFYVCSHGEAHLFVCPRGLRFNVNSLSCDWAQSVACGVTSSPTTTTTTTPKTITATSGAVIFPTTSIISTSQPSSPATSSHEPNYSTSVEFGSTAPTVFTSPTTTLKTTTTSSVSGSPCGLDTQEPISNVVREKRISGCMLPASAVEDIYPGSLSNPDNVRILESILSKISFQSLFPNANPAYTYENFLKAVGAFPAVCSAPHTCRKLLAAMFAHFQQETAGLFYLEEINRSDYCASWTPWVTQSFPCTPGQKYYGRGAKQLSWNYNYGAFSLALFGDASVLLDRPDLVASTWLNLASALWFLVTPQPPKPSMLEIITEEWSPNNADIAGNILPGFGATTMVINGAMECGPSPPNTNASPNRQRWYREYAAMFDLDITEEKLGCEDMAAFSAAGAANLALYWAPESACSLVTWQTALSALVEGNYRRCVDMMP